MDDQKLDDLLNLSLDATQEEREKSLVLEEGYDPTTAQWELIVKYSGAIISMRQNAAHVICCALKWKAQEM